MNPNNNVYQYQAGGQDNGRKRLLVIAGLVIIVAAALTYFFLSAGGRSKGPNSNQKQTNSDTPELLSGLPNFSFVSPSNMEGYRLDANYATGISNFTTTDNGCNLQYGVIAAGDMPGANEKEIILNNLGLVGTGVTTELGKSLTLKDSTGSPKYTMPAYDLAYTKDNVNYKTKFAIIILPEFKRAFIRQYCASTEGPISNTAFQKLNNKAQEITVKRPTAQ